MRLPDGDAPVWMDGEWTVARHAGVHLGDAAVLAGLGVYETLGVHDGRCLEPEQHLDRLEQAARHFDVALRPRDALRDAMDRIARDAVGEYGWLKIVATRGGSCFVFGGPLDRSEHGRPASAVLLDWRRHRRDPLAGWKTLAYAPFALGLEQARRRGADEGLWRNDHGHVAEGCSSNVFAVRHRAIYTPAVREGILPGITRGLALRAARRLKLTVHEDKLRLKRLEDAHEAFLTSSVLGVRPLVRFEGRPVGNGEPGEVTRSITRKIAEIRAERAERGQPVDG